MDVPAVVGGEENMKNLREPINSSWFLNTVLYLLKEDNNWKFSSKKIILSLSNKIIKKLI